MSTKIYENCVAFVSLDSTQATPNWIVVIEDMDGRPVDRLPINDRRDAEIIADAINQRIAHG